MDGFGNYWYEAAPNDPGHVMCKEFLDFPLTNDAQYAGGEYYMYRYGEGEGRLVSSGVGVVVLSDGRETRLS
jgi:hypothetical protein